MTETTKVLRNGAIYDMDKKRIVGHDQALAVVDTQFTQANASAIATARQERKRLAVAEAANLVAHGEAAASTLPAVRALVGDDLAWVKAVAMGRTAAAIDKDNPYGNAAASWLMDHAGYGERRQEQEPAETVGGLLRQLTQMAQAVSAAREAQGGRSAGAGLTGQTDTDTEQKG